MDHCFSFSWSLTGTPSISAVTMAGIGAARSATMSALPLLDETSIRLSAMS